MYTRFPLPVYETKAARYIGRVAAPNRLFDGSVTVSLFPLPVVVVVIVAVPPTSAPPSIPAATSQPNLWKLKIKLIKVKYLPFNDYQWYMLNLKQKKIPNTMYGRSQKPVVVDFYFTIV